MTIKKKVVIVGGGAAGLQCAKSLVESGIFESRDVVILEGRDRIGGRIHTLPLVVPEGFDATAGDIQRYYDAGACWIHGTSPLRDANGNLYFDRALELLLRSNDARLVETFPAGNPWTRPRQLLVKKPSSIQKSNKRKPQHEFQHLAVFVDQKRAPTELIEKALELHEFHMRSAAKVGAAAYEMGEGMTNTRISLSDTIGVIKDFTSRKQQIPCPSVMNEEQQSQYNEIAEFFVHLLELWHCCPSSSLQLGAFASQDINSDIHSEDESGFPGPHCVVSEGMESILQPLLEGIEDCIMYEQEVITIEYLDRSKENENDQVGISSTRNNGKTPSSFVDQVAAEKCIRVRSKLGFTFQADFCVITLPLGCLKDAVSGERDDGQMFCPRLSREKEAAIRALGMGNYKKVRLMFNSIFWPVEETFIGLIRGKSNNKKCQMHGNCEQIDIGDKILLHNLWGKTGLPIVEAVLVGEAGENAKYRSDGAIQDALVEFMEKTIGSNVKAYKCLDCHVTRWEEDKFSKGAFSNMVLGSLERHCNALQMSEWDGRLLFAGEATESEHQGSVHAALTSGERAAHVITESLRDNS